MEFEFVTVPRIIFGEGGCRHVGQLAAELGERALVVCGSSPQRRAAIVNSLENHHVEAIPYFILGEPTVDGIQMGVNVARERNCDLVIGCGGGSALDASKAIAILITNEGEIYDYLEVIGKGKSLARPSLPLITIPTTAGTGAEVTRNAVIGAPDHRVKVSLRSSMMLARIAIIDPELTYSMPSEVVASTGMDALTQLIEPFVSNKANPITDTLCREGMRRAARALPQSYQNDNNTAAKMDMSLASLYSGLALANAKLGIVHGMASVLGGMFHAPHGAICARLLPPVMAINIRAIMERGDDSSALVKFDEIARILTGNEKAVASDGIEWARQLGESLQISPLSAFGVKETDFPAIVEKSAVASSTKGNPILLTTQEMTEILYQAI